MPAPILSLILLFLTLRCDIASSELQPIRLNPVENQLLVMYIFRESKFLLNRGQQMASYRQGESQLAECLPAQATYRRAALILIRKSDRLGAGFGELRRLPRIVYSCLSCSDEQAELACHKATALLNQICP